MMKKIKKLVLLALMLLSMFALIACSEDDDDDDDEKAVAAKNEEDAVEKFIKAFENKNLKKASEYYIIDLEDLIDKEMYKLYSKEKAEMMMTKGCYVTMKAKVTFDVGDKKEYSMDDLKASYNDEDAKELEYLEDVEGTIYGFDSTMKMEMTVVDTRVDIAEAGLSEKQLEQIEDEYGMSFDEYFEKTVKEDMKLDEPQETKQVIFVGKYKGEWKVLNLGTPAEDK